MIDRRRFLLSGISLLGLAAVAGIFGGRNSVGNAAAKAFEVTKTEEWRRSSPTSSMRFARGGHGISGSRPLLYEKPRAPQLVGCDRLLFRGDQYESGTGLAGFGDD